MSNPNAYMIAEAPADPMAGNLMEEPSMGLGARLGNLADRAGEIASRVSDLTYVALHNAGDAITAGYEYVADRYDSLKFGAKTLAAIGGIAFVGAQAAELTASAEPVMAGTGNTPQAVASGGLAKYCKQKMANLFPTVTYMKAGTRDFATALLRPGERNQLLIFEAETQDAPEQCVQAGWRLGGTATTELGQPDQGHKDPYDLLTVHYGNKGHAINRGVQRKGKQSDSYYYGCSKHGDTPVWVDMVNKVVDPNGRVEKVKKERHNVPVLNGHVQDASC